MKNKNKIAVESGSNTASRRLQENIQDNIYSKRILVENINIDHILSSGAVKYQGNCGACYAFAAADCLGALNAISSFGFFVSLSVQQIVDCSTNPLTFGCDGGFL